jgi:hypothetical protein
LKVNVSGQTRKLAGQKQYILQFIIWGIGEKEQKKLRRGLTRIELSDADCFYILGQSYTPL